MFEAATILWIAARRKRIELMRFIFYFQFVKKENYGRAKNSFSEPGLAHSFNVQLRTVRNFLSSYSYYTPNKMFLLRGLMIQL